MKHIRTVDQTLTLEFGFGGDISAAGLSEAIIEALEGVINTAGVVYIKASSPNSTLMGVDLWAPEPVEDVEPPHLPPCTIPETGGGSCETCPDGDCNRTDRPEPNV